MSPSAISLEDETLSSLTNAAVQAQIQQTTPIHPSTSTLAPLDASKLIFTQNTNPQEVPGPNSAAVENTSTCTDHMITAVWYVASSYQF